jgi:hypothetical protein
MLLVIFTSIFRNSNVQFGPRRVNELRDQASVVGGDDQLGAVTHFQLHEQAADVGLGGGQADMQPCCDLGVGQAEPAEGQDFAFPLSYLIQDGIRAVPGLGAPGELRDEPRGDGRERVVRRRPRLPGSSLADGLGITAAGRSRACSSTGSTAELARHKLGRISADDADGYHRVTCPAAMSKIRCQLRPPSMTPRPEPPGILTPPSHPPACCTQQTITVPPQVAARTRQKHDYPSAAHRRSYARRTGSERTFSTIKDPATTSFARGWCRLTGLIPLYQWLACLLTVRNQRILHAWNARQEQNARRAAAGLPPKTRKRRRTTLASLAAAPP